MQPSWRWTAILASPRKRRNAADTRKESSMRLKSVSQRGHSNARSTRNASLLLVGEMDTLSLDALELSEPSCWGDGASSHKLAEALSLLLPLLPLDCRARAACVCRAWRAATAHPALWEELNFEHCAVRVYNATLASTCRRRAAHAVSWRTRKRARHWRWHSGSAARRRLHRPAVFQRATAVVRSFCAHC